MHTKTAFKFRALGLATLVMAMAFASVASANTTVVVTPDDTMGWSTADTRVGGTVTYIADPSSPYPEGALRLTTDSTTTAKAQYLHSASTSISEVTSLSYDALHVAGPVHADPSYQLLVDLNGGTTGGFTTFVYEPYQNGTVAPAVWQHFDVDAGMMWSSRSFSEGDCTIVAGGGGAPFYTLAELKDNCSEAVVIGFGVNVGSNNPDYDVRADGVEFNGTVYDFELEAPVTAPTSKDECKKGGWKDFTNPSFKNQGQCVSSVEKNK